MSGLREGAAAEAPAWKLALLERKRAKLAAGMGLERGRVPAPRPGQGPDGREAGPVVAESLGPLRENPFMRLESEQRRRRRRGACELPGPASSPSSPAAESPALAQLLQLYGAMPGIRTIRADNILIIESSDPAEAAQGGALGRRSPLRDLLARRGPPPPPPVTEIRAVQVVVYEPEAPPPLDEGPDSGLVSRLLQKFDRAAQGKGGRGGDGPALPVPPPPGPPAARPAPSPGPQGGGGGGNVFLQKIGSNSFVVNPRGHRAGLAAAPALSNGPAKAAEVVALPPASSAGQRGVAAVSKAVPSSRSPTPSSPSEAEAGKPKCQAAAAPETSAQPPAPSSATLDSRPSPLFSSSCSFEIRPAPKPDLAAIAAHDLQARALASLRLNSRNSFLFVPHRKEEPPGPPPPAEALPAAPEEEEEEKSVPVTYIDEDLVAAMPPLKVLSPRLEGFHVPREGALTEDPDLPTYRPFPAASIPRTSTFTVVPKRKPPAASPEPFSRAWVQEEEEEEDQSQREGQMGALQQESGRLKKRYPTVNEIEVIGGYLSLHKSCMSKSGIRRKKMKISFNETSLQTMFEYPSESSLVEEEEEEEEEEEYATEVDEKPAFRIPHPSSTVNSHPINSGLSGYTPKHSLRFNKWQEQLYQKLPSTIGALPQETDQPEQQVMLTPAEKSHLSDFSSEPALYF
ncbi:taperin [Notechis scutatus]|uniref:Taperin n=1 Tax=Notechis scutatus TaxID=8663 RepID=A0A6J1VGQ2_9SAUR|nr:taperin [Notechis scutatus]